jgi:MFS transporter, FHS family, L-fucose permease
MKRNYPIVILIFLVFFVISFLTNVMGVLIPEVIDCFHVSKTMAAFLPLFFFIAYGIMSIPAGILTEKFKEKKVMVAAFALACIGSLIFAFFPRYGIMLGSLFLIGIGMAILQVAINPLLRVAGGEEHFAFNSVMAQLFFGGASFLSPMLYSYLVRELAAGAKPDAFVKFLGTITPQNLPWVALYWIFAVIILVMILIVGSAKFPKVELKEDEKTGNWESIVYLFKNRTVVLFFIGIFCYVGTEQGTANWISEYLRSYHGMRPEVEGAQAVQWFWLLMTIGCVLGLGLLKLLNSQLVLRIFVLAAMASLAIALMTSDGKTAFYAFISVGFFASVMWSIVFSLGMNSISEHHGSFAGILCSGIMGGAIIPVIIGSLADLFSLRIGMLFIFLTMGYLLSISFWAKPLIKNKTIFDKD